MLYLHIRSMKQKTIREARNLGPKQYNLKLKWIRQRNPVSHISHTSSIFMISVDELV